MDISLLLLVPWAHKVLRASHLLLFDTGPICSRLDKWNGPVRIKFSNNLQYFDIISEADIYHGECIERSPTHCARLLTTISHICEAEPLLDGIVFSHGLQRLFFKI